MGECSLYTISVIDSREWPPTLGTRDQGGRFFHGPEAAWFSVLPASCGMGFACLRDPVPATQGLVSIHELEVGDPCSREHELKMQQIFGIHTAKTDDQKGNLQVTPESPKSFPKEISLYRRSNIGKIFKHI